MMSLPFMGYSHRDIMEQLGLAERTCFRYLAGAFEHDWQTLKQRNNADSD
jgi:hypothetical protein